MTKYSIRDLELAGKTVFIRVDFNVPIKDGRITDDTRITAALPTIAYALEADATVVLASHLGRPKGKPAPEYSLKPVADHLATLLGRDVIFASDCIGEPARQGVDKAKGRTGSRIVLLENLRYHAEEEKNDAGFAAALASLADAYVNDAFGAAHRAHASVAAMVPHFKQAAAGLLMEKELTYLGMALGNPERPFVGILGGAKVSDKIEVIESLLGRVDRLIIGGAMAYTFFKALGMPVGRSLVEDDKLDAARSILSHAQTRGVQLLLPVDHVVADKIDAAAQTAVLEVRDSAIGDRMGLDIGPATAHLFAGALKDAKTVVWNGPMGVFEVTPFAAGTMAVARACAAVKGTTIIGGGDSVAAVNAAGVADKMTHISTGGGASLEFLAGETLPGVAALPDKS
ncbi:MAG TPA: phosphoglycerate kinase [Vicinamibacterales bacterium]|nr:phosphoglycerate kinase [Vicinamibacterales bacterium]